MSKNKYEIDMCNGTIMDKLISFSVPLMLSGILQLMFNAVDIIVVGRFAGSQSLAAVGSTTALINMFVNLFIGVSLGANVLAARFYAAGKAKEMSETVHTSIMLALISGVVMAFVGVFFAKGALELMDTPADVIDQSALYMRIYFMGMPFFMLYNYGAAILRAVGDTKRPLLFLMIAGVINACLNMVLVIVFKLGVAGVAIATVISQMISCVLVLRCLCRSESSYRLRFSELGMKGYYLKQIFSVGCAVACYSGIGTSIRRPPDGSGRGCCYSECGESTWKCCKKFERTQSGCCVYRHRTRFGIGGDSFLFSGCQYSCEAGISGWTDYRWYPSGNFWTTDTHDYLHYS